MANAKFKKLDRKGTFGGNIYEYRGFKIKDETSPRNPYGEWVVRGEYKGHRIWISHNTRKQVADHLDYDLAKIDAQS